MTDGAPVCNLPNIGQVPARQAGRLYPAIPRAVDLPSLIQSVNTMVDIINILLSPGLPPFRNNVMPTTVRDVLVGTQGLNATEGADGSPSRAGKDGKEGKKAKAPTYKESNRQTIRVKVRNKDDEDTWLIVNRITKLTMTSTGKDGEEKIEWQGDVHDMSVQTGTLSNRGGFPSAATDQTGPPVLGTKRANRTVVEENSEFPTSGHSEGGAENPFNAGLMQDVIGVQWGGGLAVEFFESAEPSDMDKKPDEGGVE